MIQSHHGRWKAYGWCHETSPCGCCCSASRREPPPPCLDQTPGPKSLSPIPGLEIIFVGWVPPSCMATPSRVPPFFSSRAMLEGFSDVFCFWGCKPQVRTQPRAWNGRIMQRHCSPSIFCVESVYRSWDLTCFGIAPAHFEEISRLYREMPDLPWCSLSMVVQLGFPFEKQLSN